MSTEQEQTRVALFGATGGTVLATLIKVLGAGIRCSVLVRNADKLKTMLEPYGFNLQSKGLSITTGDVKDVEAIKQTLTFNGTEECAGVVVSGVGAYPKLQASLFQPLGMTDATICTDAGRTLLQALEQLKPSRKPLVVILSTTGLGKNRDVPLALVPLYHWLLAMPHVDKAEMERLFDQEAAATNSNIAGLVTVKPTLLTDGAAKDATAVRAGWEQTEAKPDPSAPGPAIGYSISRNNVGNWIYDNLVASNRAERMQWAGRKVSLTT